MVSSLRYTAAGQKSRGRHTVRLKIERRPENFRADLNIGRIARTCNWTDVFFYTPYISPLGNRIACEYTFITPAAAPLSIFRL